MSTLNRFYLYIFIGLTICLVSTAYSQPFGSTYFQRQGQTNTQTLAMSQSIHPDYKLGPGDELLIKIRGFQNQDIRSSVTIQGTISIPQVAPVNVLGKTILDAQEIIKENILTVLKNVSVEVDISALREFNVFVTGEAHIPGTYTATGNHSLLDLLFLCEGPTPRGSFRRIVINRIGNSVNQKEGTRSREKIPVDLYDYFINADHRIDLFLEAGDVIWIPPVGPSIEIRGEVKRPATYELTNETTLSQLVELAGGPKESAYLSRFVIHRKAQGRLYQQIDVDFSTPNGKNFLLQDGDQIHVLDTNQLVTELDPSSTLFKVIVKSASDIVDVTNSIQYDFLPTVTIIGEINRPGIYNYAPGERLDNLLLKASGLRSTAYHSRAELVRTDENGIVTHRIFSLKNALGDKKSEDNFELQNKDIINIQPMSPIDSVWSAKITGEVRNPGVYSIVSGTRLSDLIMRAGGLLELAFTPRAELTRYHEGKVAEILQIDLFSIIKDESSKNNLILNNFDHLHILSKPVELTSIVVQVNGQVDVPGAYTLPKGSTLSAALKSAGGLRPEGSLSSLILVRPSLLEEEKALLEEIGQNQEQELLRLQSSIIDSAVTDDEKQLQLRSLEIRKRIITLLGKRRVMGRLIFDPQNEDPVLKEGDSITVPAIPESVTIIGAVYGSGSITYKEGYTLEQYLNLLGGLTPYADDQQIYVIKPNGFVERKSDNMSPVMPGDVIVVPPSVEDRVTSPTTK